MLAVGLVSRWMMRKSLKRNYVREQQEYDLLEGKEYLEEESEVKSRPSWTISERGRGPGGRRRGRWTRGGRPGRETGCRTAGTTSRTSRNENKLNRPIRNGVSLQGRWAGSRALQ